MLLAGRRASCASDVAVMNDYAFKRTRIDFQPDLQARESATHLLVKESLYFQEDIMAMLYNSIGMNLASSSRLIRAVAKSNPLWIDCEQEDFMQAPGARNRSAKEMESLFEFVIGLLPRAFCKAHACSRSLWAGYATYLATAAPIAMTSG